MKIKKTVRRVYGEITCRGLALICMGGDPWGCPAHPESKSVGIGQGSGALPQAALGWISGQRLVERPLRLPSRGSRACWFSLPPAFSSLCCLSVPEMTPDTWRRGSMLVSSTDLQEVTFPRRCAIFMCPKLETWTQTTGEGPTRRLSLPVNRESETFLMFSLRAWQCVPFTPSSCGVTAPFLWDPPPDFPQGLKPSESASLCFSDLVFPLPACLEFPDISWVQLTWKGDLQGIPTLTLGQISN